jgi:HD domain-containing protein
MSTRYDDDMGNLLEWAHQRAAGFLEEQLPQRWTHVQGVANRAQLMSPILGETEGDLLTAAAVLHDIGYSPAIAITGFHPLDGARALRELTGNKRLVALVAHHSCAYREAELRGLSAELTEWVDEETPLRDGLWWADMTTSPFGMPVTVDERLAEIQDRYGPQDVVTFFIRQAEPELRGAAERTEARLRAAGISYK